MKMGGTLLIRADGNERIGTGHVMRCIALAQAWRELAGDVFFAFGSASSAMEGRLASGGMKAAVLNAATGGNTDARKTAALGREIGASWVAVDGYAFGAAYVAAVRSGGLPVAQIDDNGVAGRYEAEIVINANLYAREDLYPTTGRRTRLLLGSRFAMIRREFLERKADRKRVRAEAGRILVTMGGADPLGLGPTTIRALRGLATAGVEVRTVVGPASPDEARCREEMRAASLRGEVIPAAENMAEHMAWADVAVAAAGSTCWEMACLGLPALLVVAADNQAPIAASLHEAGIALNLGRPDRTLASRIAAAAEGLLNDAAARREMRRRGRKLIDGRGAERIVRTLMKRRKGKVA
ncbi:MAG TPA: UDP-2,4-diacetamido-2,4,6-trideoxy-beta-L-altropyranose hydrolase [Syntrophales bacterium]|nr:UDP-2,4-diacetamido-2,4,6-trideoxy-beta-L-altropyranose hydrolase [Syntrophales bacterium]